jgi:chromosome segregation ATPase
MLDSKQREAQLLQARERLARAFAQFETIIGAIPERIRLLESSRDKAQLRITEIEELLERERAITAQRQSLSDGATEEIHTMTAKLEKAEKQVAERDKKIGELEKNLDHHSGELLAHEQAHIESLEIEEKQSARIAHLEGENTAIERQLELLKEERENLQKQLAQVEEKDNTYALVFTQDERLSLLKTVDTLIERVDAMAMGVISNGTR